MKIGGVSEIKIFRHLTMKVNDLHEITETFVIVIRAVSVNVTHTRLFDFHIG